jgi:predicted membrane-bound spermidine synthase
LKNYKLVYLSLLVVSAVVICFEIISTRISSVIFVNNYAFMILSLAILGLGSGGVFAYYKITSNLDADSPRVFSSALILFGFSLFIFIIAVTRFEFISMPFVYFFFLFFPFFFAGIYYALVFKTYAKFSFELYAADLVGAALGSVISIVALVLLGGENSVLFLAAIALCSAVSFMFGRIKKKRITAFYAILILSIVFILFNGNSNILGTIPIGNFPEKDFYHVYPNMNVRSQIIDSRWSIYGRTDLVQYSHQDVIKYLFIDGAAGSGMFRFSGIQNESDRILYNLLINYSSSIPLLFLKQNEKNSMLVIGPGGGKEVLTGLLSGVGEITGVEINPDFVNIVKDYRKFNGGIYTDFPNINIIVKEGRHYIKQTKSKYDLIVMALPSTEQLQNIDNFAMSENYLLTVEAIQDYLKILTPEGRLIFTVHNKWELIRLIVSTIHAFEKLGSDGKEIFCHLLILEDDYTPTIVIKKNIYTQEEIIHRQNIIQSLPKELPLVTYLPYHWEQIRNTTVNQFLRVLKANSVTLQQYINQHPYNISPCFDDSPYFFKVKKGVPENFLWLFASVTILNLLVVGFPFAKIKKKISKNKISAITIPLTIFSCIGLGFIILEVSLFQKLVLYLGSPTISLSILLSSLLIGMGTGSFFGKNFFSDNHNKRIFFACLLIVILGILVFTLYPYILNKFLMYGLFYRALICVLMIIPFGFLLGIPFPSCIQLLKKENLEQYIPWMYGVNGTMTVLGSVLAVILSMLFGFTPAFFTGLCFYFIVFVILVASSNKDLIPKT